MDHGMVSGGYERFERHRIESERRDKAGRAFGPTWQRIELAVRSVIDGSPSSDIRTLDADLDRIDADLRYLEGITWVLGYDRRRRRSLKALRLAMRKQRKPTGGEVSRQRDLDEREVRLSEAIEAIHAVKLGWSPVLPTVGRALDPTVPLRIIVIDAVDGFGFATRLAEATDATTRISVVGVAATADDGLRLVDELDPDVVVIGTRLPDRPGLEALGEVRLARPSAAIVTLTSTESDDEFFAVLVKGVCGHVAHGAEGKRLLDVVRRSAAGEYPINDLLS